MLIRQGVFLTDSISGYVAVFAQNRTRLQFCCQSVEILPGATCLTMCSRLIHLDRI